MFPSRQKSLYKLDQYLAQLINQPVLWNMNFNFANLGILISLYKHLYWHVRWAELDTTRMSEASGRQYLIMWWALTAHPGWNRVDWSAKYWGTLGKVHPALLEFWSKRKSHGRNAFLQSTQRNCPSTIKIIAKTLFDILLITLI